jgi:signal transduction histidine kinase
MRRKILTAFLTVISILFISEAFFFAMHFVVIKKYQEVVTNVISEYRLIGDTSSVVNSYYSLIQYANDQQRLNDYNNNLVALKDLLLELDKNITDSDSWTVYVGVKSTIESVVEETDKGVADITAGSFSNVTDYYSEANKKNSFVKDNTANLLLKELGYVERLQNNIFKIQLVSEVVGLILFIVMLLCCVWYAFLFSRKISDPLLKLAKSAKALGGGDWKIKIDDNLKKNGDEAAELANSLDVIAVSLRNGAKRIKDCSVQLDKNKKIIFGKEEQIGELNEANQLKSEFMSIATKELKRSLIPIIDLSETMERNKEVLPSEYQNYVINIHGDSERLNRLIRQMLQVSGGKEGLEKERFNLDELIMSIETSLEMLARKTGSKVVFSIQDRGVGMSSDKEKISQVIYDFVDNAIKYGPNGQIVTVTLRRSGSDAVRVEVSDEGPGIPKELQDKLFLKFSQSESLLPVSHEGMGLGLYICKRNVEILGGEIGVLSGNNKGAIFYFVIPLLAGKKEEEEED